MIHQRRSKLRTSMLVLLGAILFYDSFIRVECAPASTNKDGNKNDGSNRLIGSGLLSNLFRRQTSSTGSEPSSTTTTESSTEQDPVDDPQAQTELEAQKFMDSLPNPGGNESGPTTFRERVSESFGLLRDGVSNQFRSIRENFSETVEDLRDTWSNTE